MKKSANYFLENVEKWMAPKKGSLPLLLFPSKEEVLPEPLGLVLILASWNFPFFKACKFTAQGPIENQFPNIHDILVAQKNKFNETYRLSKSLLSGSEWYCHQAFRALNQAADGRFDMILLYGARCTKCGGAKCGFCWESTKYIFVGALLVCLNSFVYSLGKWNVQYSFVSTLLDSFNFCGN